MQSVNSETTRIKGDTPEERARALSRFVSRCHREGLRVVAFETYVTPLGDFISGIHNLHILAIVEPIHTEMDA